ncbi:MAG TPA: MmgE/PrpD family protein, partial [Actinomycetota bacterium]|nr:MmgE/PrpD family protein [Actinomycetota bacterium]
MTIVEGIAAWAHALKADDVPGDVAALCRTQQRAVLGGVAGSSRNAAARRVISALAEDADDGPAPLLTTDRNVAIDDALYAAAALSMALDFDDYVCFGHSGHSSVLVPLFLAYERDRDAPGRLAAQAVANEVSARLGGACLIGPLNGQMWSFIHAAGAALAAGKMLGLDERALAQALALALYQAPRPVVPGFMAPDSKLLTAAEPIAQGVRAARLAAHGVTGPLDVLDRSAGFFSAFSYAPIRGLLGGLGKGWATKTLCVKPYPGCAYIDSTIDALGQLGPVDPTEVERVEVQAGLLTCGMDALSQRYTRAGALTPVTINFSLGLNVAVYLLAGRLGPRELDDAWLRDHSSELRGLAERVHLEHDWELTRSAMPSFARLLPPGLVRREVGGAALARGLVRARRDHPRVPIGLKDARALIATFGTDSVPNLAKSYWDPGALADFRMELPARVTITTKSGRRKAAEVRVPRGAAGHADGPAPVASAKLLEVGPWLWGEE